MNKSILLLLFLLLNIVAYTQNVLLLQKRGKTQKSYFAGSFISIETKQGSSADGLITKIQNDSIYIRHFDIEKSITDFGGIYFDTAFRYTTAIHYKDIGAWVIPGNQAGRWKWVGNRVMIAGVGVLALGAINGLYRGDKPRDWYKPSSYIVAGALTGLGAFLRFARKPKLVIGKKYSLKILQLDRR